MYQRPRPHVEWCLRLVVDAVFMSIFVHVWSVLSVTWGWCCALAVTSLRAGYLDALLRRRYPHVLVVHFLVYSTCDPMGRAFGYTAVCG